MSSRRVRTALGMASVILCFSVALPASASASGTVRSGSSFPATGSGIDVSFPQCVKTSHVDFPANAPFAVIGVNGGVATNDNPCFASEYHSAFLLAGTSDQPRTAVYVNTGNPGLAAAWWPKDDHTRAGTPVFNPSGACDHLAGAPCAYVYGYSVAQADYRRLRATLVAMPKMWWLDVETSNTWQPDLVANAASLSGMVDYFESKGLDVGLYSTAYQWGKIAGATSETSNLAGLPSWLAGSSLLGAAAACQRSPLTPNGRVAMVQYVMHLDNDYSCRQFARATVAIAPRGSIRVGVLLTASGTWVPADAAFSYQWNRSGSAIPGATAKTYETTPADAGSTLTVSVTGRALGYSTTLTTSDGIVVPVDSQP